MDPVVLGGKPDWERGKEEMKQYCDCCAGQLTPIYEDAISVAVDVRLGGRTYTVCQDCADVVKFVITCQTAELVQHIAPYDGI